MNLLDLDNDCLNIIGNMVKKDNERTEIINDIINDIIDDVIIINFITNNMIRDNDEDYASYK